MKPHQQSQKEHGGDRMKTSMHKEVEHLLRREIQYGCVTDTGKCADCQKTAKYLVVEKRQPNDHDYFRAWYYCGVCEVG